MRRKSNAREATNVFVVAAADIVRAGLAALVASDERFVVAGDAAELAWLTQREAEDIWPDILLVDVGDADEPIAETLAVLATLADEQHEGASAVVLLYDDDEGTAAVARALRAGVVRAVLPRAASSQAITAAIAAAAAGLIALPAQAVNSLLSAASSLDEAAAPSSEEATLAATNELDALTPREREVLNMLAEGLANKEIAGQLGISEHTVKFHVASVFAKLGAASRAEAVTIGFRRGMIML